LAVSNCSSSSVVSGQVVGKTGIVGGVRAVPSMCHITLQLAARVASV